MQQPYRVTKLGPDKDETLVASRAQAENLLSSITAQLEGKLSRHDRAVKLAARATLLNVLGDAAFLPAAREAYAFSKTAHHAYLVACAMHMDGDYAGSLEFYKRAHDLPHDPGFKIDVSYASMFLVKGDWLNWHKEVRKLKQRAVYAAYLPEWHGELPIQQLSIIGEGGYGDIILHSRWYKELADRGIDVTFYLADYFFEHQFMDLYNQQGLPKVKRLKECPGHIKAIGVFDLPALWDTTPATLLPNLQWYPSPEAIEKYAFVREVDKLNVGICWSARSSEAPFVADGVYRSLLPEQVQRIIDANPQLNWVNVQYKPEWVPNGVQVPDRAGWADTAGLLANLDLLVTVDTGTMHLAGAMGVPTWVLLSGAHDAKFGLTEETMPWYPTLRLFRNNAFGFENAVNNLIAAITASDLAQQIS